MKSRKRIGLLMLLAAAGLTAVGWWVMQQRPAGAGTGPLPPPSESPPHDSVTFADFAGAEACAECHRAQHDAWARSTHGHAGGPPTRERLLAPFDGRPIRFRDAVVTPSVTSAGAFIFSVAQQNRPVRVFRVDAVVGGGHMVGGGTQALFSRFPDGTLRFLPFDYSRTERRWFCQPRVAERGWIPITPEVALADCGAWPPARILGSSRRLQGCQQCHGSQIEFSADPATRSYRTRYTTLTVNCESCHGPGRRHIELARSGRIADAANVGMQPLETLSKNQSLEVCFQCHAAKVTLEQGYLPGKRLPEHFALKLPLLLDTTYFADGRTRDFGYQEGHLSSDCYLNGSMTCVDCHDPHSQRYRDVAGAALPGRFADGQCVGCHASKAAPVSRHTHHPDASAGSRCVACHMPYLQQPGVGPAISYARSDHTIPVPRPAFDSKLGLQSACQQCHRDRTPAQLNEQVTAWWGTLKPHPAPVSAVFSADSLRDPAAAARTVLAAPGGHPMATFAGLTRIMQRYADPDLPVRDRKIIEGLSRLARHEDAEVRALALATLHLSHGGERGVRRVLTRVLADAGPADPVIRKRWLWILRVRGDAYLAGGDHGRALTAYRRASELDPDDPVILRGLGVVHTRLRNYGEAIQHLRRSLAAEPTQADVMVDLGFALMQQGDLDGAIGVFRQATAADPWDPAGYANLGVAYLRRGTGDLAVEALEKAVSLGPGLSAAHFALASAYAGRGQTARAAASLEQGLEFDPGNNAARAMLESLRRGRPGND